MGFGKLDCKMIPRLCFAGQELFLFSNQAFPASNYSKGWQRRRRETVINGIINAKCGSGP
jgi:hypothetical protein